MLIQCNGNKTNSKEQIYSECDTILKNKKVIEKEIPLYEVDKSFLVYLDTIVESEKKCSFYSKCTSSFLCYAIQEDEGVKIEITSINKYRYGYENCFAIFKHKDMIFACEKGFPVENLLLKTNRKEKVIFYDVDRSDWNQLSHNDRATTWAFNYKNNHISFRNHFQCVKDE